ncbi:acyl-CoA thioesterase [Sporichthya polymorpha]|uniref:acyl-CoA thioesterase n=1 Tax=Sporichthya polymorpha TaxID=35751 RepID=UPI00035D16F4|nr:thioesterase family protein [Sporichthya polymorpha]
MSEPIVRAPIRVRYHECDGQKIVFNAWYLAYADIAVTEAARALFGSYAALEAKGADIVVAEANVRYFGSAGFDDELIVEVWTERLGNTSMVLRFDVMKNGELITRVTTRYVWVDTETLKPKAPPTEVREAFAAHLLEEQAN